MANIKADEISKILREQIANYEQTVAVDEVGSVISVGDGKLTDDGTRKPLQVKPGDRVLFTSYAGEQFKIGDEELLLMHEEDILAVIE